MSRSLPISRYTRAFSVVQTILTARRQFRIVDYDDLIVKQVEYKQLQGDYVDPRDGQTKHFRCLFCGWGRELPPKEKVFSLGTDALKAIITQCKKTDHFIFVVDKISFQARNELQKQPRIWEHLPYEDVQYDVLANTRQGRYTLVKPGELPSFLKIEQLPTIHARTDPAARALGLRVGDVVRVLSSNARTAECLRYRVCRRNTE